MWPFTPTGSRFYGWTILVVGFVVYGFGIAPAYYSWGSLAPGLIADLGLNREQIGGIFGTFTLTFAMIGPLTALAIRRLGLRVTVTGGALLAAAGFWLTSRADSAGELYWSFAFLGGAGIGLSCGLPAQTMAVYWFRRFRATAIAITMLGAAIIGFFVPRIDARILETGSWRDAWVVVAIVSLAVAVVAAVFIRNRPEDVGQLPDGADPAVFSPGAGAEAGAAGARRSWTVLAALRTPQFLVATLATMTNVLPWRIITAHGALHFEDLGFAPAVAAGILSWRIGVSAFGRVSGLLGDIMSPTKVMALALAINGAGLLGLLRADSVPLAYLSVVLLGIGYGAGYISEPVVFAHYFGRSAFAGLSGLRAALIGIAGWLTPRWAGAAADATGSYDGSLLVLAAGCAVGAVAIVLCRRPIASPDASPVAETQ